ncbi:MAG: DUF4430 domain-containing protein [Phycisphaerae bacterium]
MRGRMGLRFVLLVLSVVAVPAVLAAVGGDPAGQKQAVRLIVDYGDGVEKHFTAIPWKKGMTVLEALKAAASHRHGIVFKHRGRGETALLTQIDDLKNAGAGADRKNWIYWVNEKPADKSFGLYALRPKDVVRWKYATYRFD